MSRIAILTPYSLPTVGGISTFISGLSRSLATRGHAPAILSARGTGDVPDRSDLGEGASYVRRASRLLGELSPDIIHCHSHWPMLEAGVRHAKTHPGVRLVFSFHTTPRFRRPARFRNLLERVDVVTFVSRAQQAEIKETLDPSGDLRILRPAVSVAKVDRAGSNRWKSIVGLSDASPVLTFMGPLDYPRKVAGVIDLVRCIPALLGAHPGTRLVIAGDGRLRHRVESAASKVGTPVRMLGTINETELLLGATDVYCHISYQEGMPLALLEAMSAGCCVVASRTGGIPEVVNGENGLLVDPGVESIASAVGLVAGNDEIRRRMGHAATATIQSSHTWASRIAEVESLYGLR